MVYLQKIIDHVRMFITDDSAVKTHVISTIDTAAAFVRDSNIARADKKNKNYMRRFNP